MHSIPTTHKVLRVWEYYAPCALFMLLMLMLWLNSVPSVVPYSDSEYLKKFLFVLLKSNWVSALPALFLRQIIGSWARPLSPLRLSHWMDRLAFLSSHWTTRNCDELILVKNSWARAGLKIERYIKEAVELRCAPQWAAAGVEERKRREGEEKERKRREKGEKDTMNRLVTLNNLPPAHSSTSAAPEAELSLTWCHQLGWSRQWRASFLPSSLILSNSLQSRSLQATLCRFVGNASFWSTLCYCHIYLAYFSGRKRFLTYFKQK